MPDVEMYSACWRRGSWWQFSYGW